MKYPGHSRSAAASLNTLNRINVAQTIEAMNRTGECQGERARFFDGRPEARGILCPGFLGGAKAFVGCLLFLMLAGAAGCLSTRPWPPANLSEPGWTVRQGQAVWRLPHGEREIAGEVLVATRSDGSGFVQFSKNPFPLVIAQVRSGRWEIEFPPQGKRYSAPGKPPLRLIWLHLPLILSGKPPPKNWLWHSDDNGWSLENGANGESLTGYFAS